MDWKPDYFRLFISHVSPSHALASQLAEVLDYRFGIHGVVAHADIEPSADWQNEIEDALGSMDALLALLTDGFSASHWCNQEVGWALGRGTTAVSVRAGEDPNGFVGRFQAIPIGDGNPVTLATRLFSVLAKHSGTAERIALTTSLRLVSAKSWESITDYISPCIDQLTVFTPDVLDNLERALRDTSHVKSSYSVGNVRTILRNHGRTVPSA